MFCSKEATLSGLLEGSRMGAEHQKVQARIRSMELSALPLILTTLLITRGLEVLSVGLA